MKIAILHEMLVKLGGAEKVVEELCHIFPSADLYTLLYDEKKVAKLFPQEKIHPSCAKLPSQKRYNIFKNQRLCLSKMIQSVEALDFSSYDVLIISSSAFAHGAITKPSCTSIVYYHAPARYLWDWTHEYVRDLRFARGPIKYFLQRYLSKLREWDFMASRRGDILLANSLTTQARIEKYFRLPSRTVFPPVDTHRFQKQLPDTQAYKKRERPYYITLSMLSSFKRIDIAVKNFPHPHEADLCIIGGGSEETFLKNLASKKENIVFLGPKYDDELVFLVQNSLGLIFPGEEDFGIVPIECMAAGKPVFALKKGGLTETVIEGKTGDFFVFEEGSDFTQKFHLFHNRVINGDYTPSHCKKQAERYDAKVFCETIQEIIAKHQATP